MPRNWLICCSAVVLASSCASAQKKVSCSDGDHYVTDIRQIAIKYDGQSLKGTLSSLSIFGATVSVEPKKLQEASEGTQLWNEYIKALVVGYNSCAVSKAEYNEALRRIYPQLKQDASNLDVIRRLVAEGRKADQEQTKRLLDSYFSGLRRFVAISGKEIELNRIIELVEKTQGATEDIGKRLDELKERVDRLEKPAQVQSEIRKSLTVKVNEAELAYNQGYEDFNRFKFKDAAESFRKALAIVKLPEFYLALGLSYQELPDLAEAETTLREGLAQTSAAVDKKQQANLNAALGIILYAKGDIAAAISYTQLAVSIDVDADGQDSVEVARDTGNLGQMMRTKGDMQQALQFSRQSLRISERSFQSNDPRLATAANNLGVLLGDRMDKGDAEEALRYAHQALAIAEAAYGPDSPKAAIYSSNIAMVLQNEAVSGTRDFIPALQYAKRALQISEKIYGPDHPQTAMFGAKVALILENMGDHDNALRYLERALAIDERAYGPENPRVGRDLFAIAMCLVGKRDFNRALSYAQRASEIHEASYGAANVDLANDLNALGMIMAGKGNLDTALEYKRRALGMDEKIHGADNIEVAHDSFDVGLFLYTHGNLGDAKSYFDRALAIETKVYGPDHRSTKRIEEILRQIQQQMQQRPAQLQKQ